MSLRAPSTYVRALQRGFAKTPEEKAAMLAGADVTQAEIDAGADMKMAALLQIVANMAKLYGRAWAMEAAPLWAAAMHGALEVAVRSAPTARAALSTLARYARVRAPYLSLALHRRGGALRLAIEPGLPLDAESWEPLAEGIALSAVLLLAPIFEDATAETSVEFPWAPPPHAEKLRARFPCRLRFDAPGLAFEAPAALGQRPTPFAEETLHARTVEDLEAALARLGRPPLAEQIAHLAAVTLPKRLGEDEAARRLGLSRRTLVRKLGHEGVAFRDVLDAALRRRAQALLERGGLSRDEMAEALGYAEPTSFSRACKRWSLGG